MKSCLTAFMLLLLAVFLGFGCASIPQDRGFGDVNRAIEEKTGQTISWNQEIDDDGTALELVHEILKHDLTADDAVQITLLNNRRVQAIYEELGIAFADLVQAGLLKNPVFDASVRWASGESATIELAVIENFLSVLFIPLRRKIAAAEFELAKSHVIAAVLDLAWETRAAFYIYQAEVRRLELQRRMLDIAEASFEVARRLHRAGNISGIDLANEQIKYEGIKLTTARTESDLREKRERLNMLMGLFGNDTMWNASSLPELPPDEMDLADIERLAIEASLELEIARKSAEVAAQRLGITRFEHLSSDTGVGINIEREDGDWSLGPLLEIPIPIFDQGKGNVTAQDAVFRRTWRDYTATAVEVRAGARIARDRIISSRQRFEYFQKVVIPLREKISDETLLEYNAMQIGPIQLLDAEIQETQALDLAIDALTDYWIARAGLEQVLNGRMPENIFSESTSMNSTVFSSRSNIDH